MVEYSGAAFALFFLAEYANMILVSFLASIFFMGGWLPPFHGWDIPLLSVDGWWWLFAKVGFFASCFVRSEEQTSELQPLMRISYADFCLKQKTTIINKSLMTSEKIRPYNHHTQSIK